MSVLEFVAVDIETTGFNVTDEVTVVGFVLPMGCRVFVQRQPSYEQEAKELQSVVETRADHHIQLSTHASETGLLRSVGEFAASRLRDDDELLLTAYNGERWRGGFDLPFLRTRLAVTDIEWPFRNLPYTDLLPIIERQFNTTRDGDAQTSLPDAYATLVDGDLNQVDPFEDSETAVTAYENGNLTELVLHNVADIHRTAALAHVTRRYCSKSDYDLKSLTPTIHDN